MKKKLIWLTALCLAVSMLTGCAAVVEYFERLSQLLGGYVTDFGDMQYSRPDMIHFRQVLDDSCEQAATETDFAALEQLILGFYTVYEDFYTNYFLATIHYSKDLTDIYWEGENTFCTENSPEVDAGLDRLYRVLAKSPLRPQLEQDDYFGADFFADYEGESVYDDTFNEMLSREATLINQYYAISGQSAAAAYYSEEYFSVYGAQMEALFVELVALRQQIAQYAGYDHYPEFAYDFYFARDYTVADAEDYMVQIQQLVPLYRKLNTSDFWDMQLQHTSEKQTMAYVQEMAENMGGMILDAFELMRDSHLYDISYGKNKFDSSFEVYLYSYQVPYVFVNPNLTEYDKLTFTHEFGHFCNDYASFGSNAGVDVAEVFSQGLEYLSLCYTTDNDQLERLRMASCLTTYVEQAAYAAFEHQVYDLRGEELTVENVRALYQSVGTAYGFDSWSWDSRDYVCINHFFTSPMYIISYVVSNDAALQLYQLEQSQQGSGLACYRENLATVETYFLAFLESAGLESPFAPGRLEAVRKTLESVLE